MASALDALPTHPSARSAATGTRGALDQWPTRAALLAAIVLTGHKLPGRPKIVSGVTMPATSPNVFVPIALPLTVSRRRQAFVNGTLRPPDC